MSDQQIEEIKVRMNEKTTEELLQIWVRNNRDEWSDKAFIVVNQILSERKSPIPSQNAPPVKRMMTKRPGRGFRTWAIVLLILAVYHGWKVVIIFFGTLPLLAACTVVGICLGPAVSFLWYRLAILKTVVTGPRYAFGCIFLGVGTFFLSNLGRLLLPSFMIAKETNLPPRSAAILLLLSGIFFILVALVFLLPSYFLCFRRSVNRSTT